MSYDGKILARARDMIAGRRRANAETLARRRAEVLARSPAVMAAEAEITGLISAVASGALKKGFDAGTAVSGVRADCEALLRRRAELLERAGFPADYLDEKYDCALCRDTGYVLGKPCGCLNAVYKAETVRELSSMLSIGDQSFERFDLSLYDDTYDREHNDSPRALAEAAFTICREYAANFGKKSANLLFRGGTGLGKTFLSASIARVVSEKGFSVVYDTAVSVVGAFELQKFDRGGADAEEVASRVRRYMDCELLLLDDLGTEMITGFAQSALYSLVNGRLLSGGKTVITTNLGGEELRRRYTPPLVSRLEGEYIALSFAGRDIRTVKRERGLR
ncbi:MAG: ATP-binding protein [Oscillospiraceae bacterium]|jgi:DNA replication protein DnaC|nr:ATP-binding protein [Oscillospiraceae bacterium]